MNILFRYGFKVGDLTFAWSKKDLYRLPFNKNNRYYSMKKLSKIHTKIKEKLYQLI